MPRTRYGWWAESHPRRYPWLGVLSKWKARAAAVVRLYPPIPAGVLAGLECIHPKESVDWHLNGGMGPQVSGGLQIALQTWIANGGLAYAPAAYLASPAAQLEIGWNIERSSGWGPWPLTSIACGL